MVGTFSLADNWELKLRSLNLKPTAILEHALLPPDLFSQHNASVTEDEYFRLFEAINVHVSDAPLGLKYVRQVPVEAYSLAFQLALNSKDMYTALQRVVTFRKLMCPMSIKIHAGSREIVVEIDRLTAGSLPNAVGTIHLNRFITLLRTGTRSELDPLWVSVVEMPEYLSAYEDDFRVRFRRGQKYAVAFSIEDMHRPFVTANRSATDVLEPALTLKLAELENAETTRYRVQTIIRELLPNGTFSVGDVSNKLDLSVRSLQRQLAKEDTTFKQLLSETRKELACYYLSHTEKPVGEVALLVGFEDSNSFFRVFKGWTGQTPGGYRESHDS